jgi:hypothetical protein
LVGPLKAEPPPCFSAVRITQADRHPYFFTENGSTREDQMAKSTQGERGGTTSGPVDQAGQTITAAGSAVAAGLQDVAQAWADYAQQVMERTTEATQALLGCRSFNDMLGVQAELMRGHLQAFLDQSTRLAEITNRMAARSLDAIRETGGEATADKDRR